MLSRVPDFEPDLFDDNSITVIANMTVSEREDTRQDGLQVLTNLAASSTETLSRVTTALRASVHSGFRSDEPQQHLRTIAFVKAIWNNAKSPFYPLVGEVIPELVEVALNADSTPARLAKTYIYFFADALVLLIRHAIPATLNKGLEHSESQRRHHILTGLLEHLKDEESKITSERLRYTFAWECNIDLVQGIFPVVFEKIVKVAIDDNSEMVRDEALCLLKELSNNDDVGASLNVNARPWLGISIGPNVRHRAIRVLETLKGQLDLTNGDPLREIIEWAAADENSDVRRSSVKLISTICKERELTLELLEVVKSAIVAVKNQVLNEGDSTIRHVWVQFLSDIMEKCAMVVPILLELYAQTESDTDLWENARKELAILKDDPEYHEAFTGALPKNLEISSRGSRDNWSTTAKWIKVLILLSRREMLMKDVNKVLQRVATNVRNEIKADENDHSGAVDYMRNSTLPPPLRGLLYSIGPNDRKTLAEILATIGAFFPYQFKDVPDILFQMAVHDSETDVQSECLQRLSQLLEQILPCVSPNDTRALVSTAVGHFGYFIESTDEKIRISYIQLLSVLRLSKQLKPLNKALTKLSNSALRGSNCADRSEAVKTFSDLTELDYGGEQLLQEDYHQLVEATVKRHFAAGAVDETEEVRRLWVKLAGSQIKDAEFPGLTKLFDAAIKDKDRSVRSEGMGTLQRLLKEVKFQALPKLIETVIKEETSDTAFESQDTLCCLFQNVELRDPIDNILPKVIESALKLNEKRDVRLAAINVFGKIIGCELADGESQSRYEAFFLGNNSDSQIISRLVDIVIKDDGDVRIAALRVLKLAFPLFRFRDANRVAFCKIIETLLKKKGKEKAEENEKHRSNARSALDSLVRFGDIASLSISQVLRTVLIDGGQGPRNSAGRPHFDNFAASEIAISPTTTTITVAGKAAVQRLIETLPVLEDTATIVVHALTPMLRSASLFSRAAAVELLLELYKKHRHPELAIFEPAILEVIALALDDKDDVGEIRITAINFLVTLSSGRTSLESVERQGGPKSWTAANASVLKKVTPLATKFMELLHVDRLRPSVVQLLSLMALDRTARQAITLRIASVILDPENPALEAHVELLSHLASDGAYSLIVGITAHRLKCEIGRLHGMATDYLMLFLAPPLLTRPELAHYKLEILTALWCRYASGPNCLSAPTSGDAPVKIEGDEEDEEREKARQKLLEWSTLALFGRHVMEHEANTWKERCEGYLRQSASGVKGRDA
ncbi:hypothetical protein EST38_g998 [Candolleomyces aberdarensis]|uniref:ARM repeat-containing protein n=1 Tax=Candolleomyces aberdarensis TaxID=2316362 RepID=A0A4Q2DY74_9AGAR|nr:hypothetical protein EST38_g998 [Candolleomyces aberdarensis]